MANHADYPAKYEAPPELDLAFQVKAWGTLPEAGGLRDQIAGEMSRLATVLNIYNAIRGFNEARDRGEWMRNNPKGWEVYKMVSDLRKSKDD